MEGWSPCTVHAKTSLADPATSSPLQRRYMDDGSTYIQSSSSNNSSFVSHGPLTTKEHMRGESGAERLHMLHTTLTPARIPPGFQGPPFCRGSLSSLSFPSPLHVCMYICARVCVCVPSICACFVNSRFRSLPTPVARDGLRSADGTKRTSLASKTCLSCDNNTLRWDCAASLAGHLSFAQPELIHNSRCRTLQCAEIP